MEPKRCSWCEKDDLYKLYHDEEWGVPVREDQRLFEALTLEAFQSGLSWYTILKKRAHFRKAFDNFDVQKVAKYTEKDVQRLLDNPGIVRHRKKIEAAVNNAAQIIKIQEEFGSFSAFLWDFIDGKPIVNSIESWSDVPSKTDLSDSLARGLKKKGFKFLGSTTCYAFMQAVGMVEDHFNSCYRKTQPIPD